MEELIQQYLLRYNYCPLPSVGALVLRQGIAMAWHGENRMSAPSPYIEFIRMEKDPAHFISFIAFNKQISVEAATALLDQYAKKLESLQEAGEVSIAQSGKFYIDENGKLVFRQNPLPVEFLPDVPLQRVIHPNAIHQVRVGDTETNSQVMTEYLSDNGKVKRSFWWIGAIVLSILALAAIMMYFNDPLHNGTFGKAVKIVPLPAVETYKSVN